MRLPLLVVLLIKIFFPEGVNAQSTIAIPKEAIAAWDNANKSVEVGQLEWRLSRWSKGVQTVKNKRLTFARNNDKVLDFGDDSDDESSATIRNDKGIFGIIRRGGSSKWMLVFAEPIGSDIGEKELALASNEIVLSLPIRIGGTNLARMRQSPHVQFRTWDQFTDKSGKVFAKVQITAESDKNLKISKGDYTVVLDPSNSFCIMSVEHKLTKGRMAYWENKYNNDGFLSQQEVKQLDSQGKEEDRAVWTIDSIKFDPPSNDIFELSYYGIENVEFASSSSHKFLYGILCLTSIVCFSIFYWLRSK